MTNFSSTTTMVALRLFCWVLTKSTSAFPVDIGEDETVGDLKKAIKAEKPNTLHGIEADDLELWKVSDCIDERDMVLTTCVFKVTIASNRNLVKSVKEVELNEDESLLATTELSDVFKDDPPEKDHLRIVVRLPLGACVLVAIISPLTEVF
jgi:hypothetical protein